jgi:small subunit ribosomal protein S6e
MAGMKAVIGVKDGRSVQKEIAEADTKQLLGKKVNDVIKGELFGLTGYEFKITGGSDYCGFPMRADVSGAARRRILAVEGVGLKKEAKGIRIRKTVCGNTIHPKIVQINLKVVKEGSEPLLPPKEAKKEEAKQEEKKAA